MQNVVVPHGPEAFLHTLSLVLNTSLGHAAAAPVSHVLNSRTVCNARKERNRPVQKDGIPHTPLATRHETFADLNVSVEGQAALEPAQKRV